MNKKNTAIFVFLFLLSTGIYAQAITYAFNGGVFRYGTINLNTASFTSLDFYPQGGNYYPATADNMNTDEQLAIMSDFGFPTGYYLWKINFSTLTGDSIAPVAPLASGQTVIKAIAHNNVNDTWYVISGDDFGTAAVLYSLDITNGLLTSIGVIQNAAIPVAMAINCEGEAYIVNVVMGMSSVAVLNRLDLTSAVAVPIGTNLGLADVSGFSQDMDFNPESGNLYWSGYWSAGFFSEGGSFRLINTSDGTSTEIGAFGQYETITGLSINANCSIVPVEMVSFSANPSGNNIELNWCTASETNNAGFEIERKSASTEWGKIGFVSGAGTSTEIINYKFRDNNVLPGSYSYRLKQIDHNGQFEYSNEIKADVNAVFGYALEQNYPNPFNPSTVIRFSVPEASMVTVSVFNMTGEIIDVITKEYYQSGSYNLNYNASGFASGVYLIKMEAGSFVSTKKITLVK